MASVIGEGSYGCVHKPQLECNKSNKQENQENKEKYISKFMLSKEAAQELAEYTTIAKIDKQKNYYLGRPFKCAPKKSRYNIKSVKKCDIYNDELSNRHRRTKKNILNKFSLLIIPDGGLDISKWMDLKKQKKNVLKKFWKKSAKLFEGALFFKKHGILHHDIKPQNVVFDIKTEKLRFIDFGLMRKIEDVKDESRKNENYIAQYPFWTYPFEFAYLNKEQYMKIAKLSLKKKKEYFNYYVKDKLEDPSSKISISCRILFDYILRNRQQTEREEIVEKYLDDFMNFILYEMTPGNYDEFLDKSLDTLDLFGVGITLQFVLCHSADFFSKEKYDALEECFFNMMRPSLLHRYSVEEAYSNFTKIMRNDKDSISASRYEMDDLLKKMDKKTRNELVMEQEELLEKKK
jgi:serine/threonine protein kinase